MSSEQTVQVIWNPIAGGSGGRLTLENAVAELRAAGFGCRTSATDSPQAAARCIAATSDDETIVIAGGDGTILSALPALTGRARPTVIFPLGTENLLAQQLGVRSEPGRLVQTLRAGRVRPFDLATVNGRHFASVLGVGFDAAVVHRVAKKRSGHIGYFDYVQPIWDTMQRYAFPAVRVTIDDRLICDEPALVFVGNIPRYAIGLKLLRNAKWDDGLLDVCVFRCGGLVEMAEHAVRAWFNTHLESDKVVYRQGRRIAIESSAGLPLQADGDPAGQLPADVRVVPAALRLLLPAE